MMNREICKYYLQGNCKFGANCKYYHPPPELMPSNFQPMNPHPPHQPNQTRSTTCKFFLKNEKCRPDCFFFHGYCERLEFVNTLTEHKLNIEYLISMTESKFITADSSEFFIRMVNDFSNAYEKKNEDKNDKIVKMAFYNSKLICAIERQAT